MSNFKNPQQRRFLFARDRDAQKGQNPMANKAVPTSINTSLSHNQIHPVPQTANVGLNPIMPQQATIPHMAVPHQGPIQPTAVPSLPGLEKMPKFGRVKKLMGG